MSEGKDLKFTLLLDYYGLLLTDKQRNVMELYYNEDLSLGEISEHEKITRQGVRDSIKRGEAFLIELEDKLGIHSKFSKISEKFKQIRRLSENAYAENKERRNIGVISELLKEIYDISEEAMDFD